MTPSQLRQWSFENNQPDQWWFSLDEVMEETPVTADEIAEYLSGGQYSNVQALHVSQADIQNAPWTEVTLPPVLGETPVMHLANVESNEQLKTDESVGTPPSSDKVKEIQVSLRLVCAIMLGIPVLAALTLFLFPEILRFNIINKATTSHSTKNEGDNKSEQNQDNVRATGIALTLEKRKALYRDAILFEREAKQQAEILFPMPDINSKEYRESGVALSILTKQNEEADRIKKERWKALVRDYGVTEDALIEIIVEGSIGKWPKS